MTIEDLRQKQLILFECISGSRAYGLELPHSDTDIKGVFVLPQADYYGMNYIEQINDESNDIVFYELKRFIELLYKNNPNLLEMLEVPEDKIIYCHPLFQSIKTALFLSKKCRDSFAGYAMTQIRKAHGLNKKIRNPVDLKMKSILEFCYVVDHQGSAALTPWLKKKGMQQEQCGLAKIPKMKDLYGLYYDKNREMGLKGIMRKESANDVLMSSIPKGLEPLTHLSFNKDGYTKYRKDYKDYWDWVKKRNEARYENTIAHAKNYDAKNMMHTFRLLDMAVEILSTGKVIVKRPNREALLAIRRGEFEYNELIAMANQKLKAIDTAFASSQLPDQPNFAQINQLLFEIRKAWYALKMPN